VTPPLLVLHAFGDPAGGAPWRAALESGGWAGEWRAPDLPGHGAAPAPVGGFYEQTDPAVVGLRTLVDACWTDRPVVVGVGPSAVGAELLALGGRTAHLVLVDGLGPPWPVSADAAMAAEYEWLRAVAADTATGQPDPRIRHGYSPRAEQRATERYRAGITTAVLAVETGASPTPEAEVDDRLAAFGGPATCVRLPAADPAAVLALAVAPSG
jgi:hypothetical protein